MLDRPDWQLSPQVFCIVGKFWDAVRNFLHKHDTHELPSVAFVVFVVPVWVVELV